MKLLLVGGTGTISAGVATLAAARGIDLYILNRGQRQNYGVSAKQIKADCHNEQEMLAAVGGMQFDCVIDFVNFNAETMRKAVQIWSGRTKQYIFISSASVYEKPVKNPVITEETPLRNPFWLYSQNKIEAENFLQSEIKRGFPGVIVRPSLTYSDQRILFSFYPQVPSTWPLFDRILRGKPIIVQGDGLSLWCITHNSDFATGLLGLLGNPQTIGEVFHITNDEIITWDGIYNAIGHALGVEPVLCHISSQSIIRRDPSYEGILLGDHSCSVIFDNSKIKRFVPEFKTKVYFEEGAKRCVSWHKSHPETQILDPEWEKKMDFFASLA